jgi:hypothetical protein
MRRRYSTTGSVRRLTAEDLTQMGGSRSVIGVDRRVVPEVREVITGALGRRRWGAEAKARIVAESLEPGTMIRKWRAGTTWSAAAVCLAALGRVGLASSCPLALRRRHIGALRLRPERSHRERVNRTGMFHFRRTPVSGSNR